MKTLAKQTLFLLLLTLFVLPQSAEAIPGFARQMGMECSACHAQNIPMLNRFGREFARSGFTMSSMSGPQTLIEGSDIGLGLPSILNGSAVLRASYTLSSDDGNVTGKGRGNTTMSDRGVLGVFDKSVLIFGGRFAENVGGIARLGSGTDINTTSSVGLSAKVTIAYDMLDGIVGVTLYSAGGTGPFSGMESYNTGLYTPLRMFENGKSTNAAQLTGVGAGSATGLQAYYGGAGLFASAGIYVPAQNSTGLDVGHSLIPFGRLGYEIIFGSWTLTPGVYGIKGSAKLSDTALNAGTAGILVTIDREAYGLDLQVEGTVAEMQMMIILQSVLKNETSFDPATINHIGNLRAEDDKATSLEVQINPISKLGIKAAALTYDTVVESTGKGPQTIDKNTYSFGVNYGFRQNLIFDVEYTYTDPKTATYDASSDLFLMATVAF